MPKTQAEILTLDFNLAELPSAQHRAGLAGLILMIRELEQQEWFEIRQEEKGAVLSIENLDQYGATIELNLEGLIALFDLAYLSFLDPRKSKNKIKEFKEIEEIEIEENGKKKIQKYYVYEVITPKGAFLEKWDKSDKQVWLKIWRDMFWSIIKGVPATRNPFNNRCGLNLNAGDSFSKDVESVWKSLQNAEKTTGQSGAFYLGAMAVNAENVSTDDLIKWQFLLHFWAFVAQVYCPYILDKDGKRNFNGYVIVIPDIANLEDFCDILPDVLSNRNSKAFGFRPQESVIDVPEQGALELLNLIKQRIAKKAGSGLLSDLIVGVEVIHAEKQGNSIKLHSVSYLQPNEESVDDYNAIKNSYYCPWFRRQLLLNLVNPKFDLASQSWLKRPPWDGFGDLLSRIPQKWLKENNSYFSHDARQLFTQKGGFDMTTTTTKTREYAEIVYKIAQGFVLSKLSSKHDLQWSKSKGNPKLEREYNDKKEKVVNEAFLAIRSRTEKQAFIDYFVSTLYPHVRQDEFVDFAQKLFQDTDEIRSLTLLALSSQYPIKRQGETE
jgi:CRISPR-associated protein Cmx8